MVINRKKYKEQAFLLFVFRYSFFEFRYEAFLTWFLLPLYLSEYGLVAAHL